MNDKERKVLAYLAERFSPDGFGYCSFASISAGTSLDRKIVRRREPERQALAPDRPSRSGKNPTVG